ncbi:TetR/AcrR family transcriptional regulator [Microbulbifer thermotolerans]|uniref:HTH tetR-type domain-containing protein n=1 Tax=Microbulbifer thermotolerans TaxID=252514 RepID=A0A143HLI0_MICTH|nr:TetR/AcrR family transcriptional regulator [Microbulbifer thermotolerans]AMX02367.1 hypothetical protein A3224_07040 [Microbulbifer thermotolerans]
MSKVDKEDIIRAAEEVLREKGARRLTLDAVAARCGLSKGGLLHHFRSKQSLLQAMLESAIASEEALAAEYAANHENSVLASRIYSAFALMQDEKQLPRALIAAVAEDPALLEPIKAKEAKIRATLSEHCRDPELALLLILATRGLFLGRQFGVLDPDDPIFNQLRERLLNLAAELE